MKAISKQGHQFCGNHFAAATLRQTLKRIGVKNIPGNGGWLSSGFTGGSSLPKKSAHVARRSSIAKKRELKSANDATLQLQHNSFDESALCLKTALLDEGGSASVVPLDHPLVMAYISSCQQDNRMIYVSQQIAKLGFTAETWLGKTDLRLQQIHEDDRDRLALALQHSLSTGERFNCHYRLYDSSGKVRWFNDEAGVVRDESGTPLFIRGVMLDITDKKEMEAELSGHRYNLERYVEQRTGQQMKRLALLESCNASLCDKLELAQRELTALKQQLALSIIQPDPVAQSMPTTPSKLDTQTNDCAELLDGISDWARNMIEWRVAAAGTIA